jgi:hypothetical protein
VVRIDIKNLWRGRAATPNEAVILTLTGQPDALVVNIDAPFHKDPAPEGPVGPTPRLWETEVVELFIAGPGTDYIELEFNPYGHWLALRLDGVRNIVDERLPIRFSTFIAGRVWSGRAVVPRSVLPAGPHRVNATAMHGGTNPRNPRHKRRHLSWQPLQGTVPDFHQLEAFAPVELP